MKPYQEQDTNCSRHPAKSSAATPAGKTPDAMHGAGASGETARSNANSLAKVILITRLGPTPSIITLGLA
jgi:hypothetical protein